MAGRPGGLYAGSSGTDVDPKVPYPDAAGSRPERPQQLARPHPEFLGDDRGVGLDIDGETLEPNDPTRPGRRGHTLGDDRLEGRDRAREAQLVLEPQGTGGVGDPRV